MNSSLQRGFILPALIVFSLVLMSLGLVVLQYVSSTTNSVQTAFYGNMAKEAANAGAAAAYSCLRDNNAVPQWTGVSKTLTPASNCSGVDFSGGADCNTAAEGAYADTSVLSQADNGSWRTRYSVCAPTVSSSGVSFISRGYVNFYYAGSSSPTRTYTNTTKVNIPFDLSSTSIRKAVGKAVTQIDSGANASCAVANQQAYCWGVNNVGQMAQGGSNNTPRTSPTLINTGALGNKRVTSVDMGYTNGCAIADGRSYCWGISQRGQLGNGSAPGFLLDFDLIALLAATRYQPTKTTGALNNANVTKISQSWTSDSNADRTHACALSNGSVYCWGSNFWGQLGQPSYLGLAEDPLCSASGWVSGYIIFVPSEWLCRKPLFTGTAPWARNDLYSPTPIFGFSTRSHEDKSLLYQKRATDFDVGVSGDCVIVNGSVYCWGDLTMQVRGGADPTGGLTIDASESYRGGSLSGKYATSVATATSTGCATADGQMHCWGRLRGDGTDLVISGNGTPKAVTSLPGGNAVITRVETSTELSGPICGVGSGDAYCWGIGQPNTYAPMRVGSLLVDGSESITDVSTGGANGGLFGLFSTPGNSCYLANATVYCIGRNDYGQLGNGTTTTNMATFGRTSTSSPETTIGLTEGKAATQISSGTNHSCAIIDGQPYCWGNGTQGKLGTGDTLNRTHPSGVSGLPDTRSSTQVDAGDSHTCSITRGHAYCWGSNASGQVGTGANNPQLLARAVTGNGIENMAVTDISAGRDHTCAVANGRAYCWGNNTYGQLGTGNTTSSSTPIAVRANSGDPLFNKHVTKIAAGDRFTCAIADGQPYCWGERANGKIGVGGTSGNQTTPVQLSSMTGTSTDIDAGPNYACAIQAGIPYCWGSNSSYQLGLGNTTDQTTPQVNATLRGTASDPNNTTSISLGATSACAITNGRGYCWGSRANGRIGNGGTTSGTTQTPTAITEIDSSTDLGPQNIPYQISTGGFGSCAVANARIYCWGEGSSGQIGNDLTPTNTITPTVTADYTRDTVVVSWSNTIFY